MRPLLFALVLGACAPSTLPPEDVFAEARFVDDVDGDDSADGTSPETAWRSLARVNAFIPRTSTRISFKRGGTWRGQLVLHGGSAARGWVAFSAYGAPTAPKPSFIDSVDVSDGWADPELDGVWERSWEEDLALPGGDVAQGPGNLWFLDDAGAVTRWGFRKQRRDQLAREGDFFYAPTEHRLSLVAHAPPSGRIEASRNRTWADFSGQSFLVVEDLSIRFAGGYALRGHAAGHLRFRRLDVSWSGGGTKQGEYVRLGNGVELEGSIEDAVVEDSRFFQLYDTGVDSQATGSAWFTQRGVTFRRNVISRMGLACFELWGRGASGSRFDDVRFEHNTCLFSGGGWGFEQHDHVGQSQLGADVVVFENSAEASGVVLRDNLFHGAQLGFFAQYHPRQVATRALVDGATIDWNLYSGVSRFLALLYVGDDVVLLPSSEKFTALADWRAAHGKEAHGVEATDPGFVALGAGDPFHDDLRVREDSAARHAASDGGFVGALGP